MQLKSNKDKFVLKAKLFFVLHSSIKAILPMVVFLIIVLLKLPILAYILILLSKWRVFMTKPRFWWFNLQINAIDIMVGLSLVYCINYTGSLLWQQFIWLGFYFFWVFVLKSMKKRNGHLIQGVVAQALGVAVLSYNLQQLTLLGVLIGVWFISILAGRHILNGLPKQSYHLSLVHIWGLFSTQLAWILLHWQIKLWIVPRLVFLQAIILLALAFLHHLYLQDKLQRFLKRQIIASTLIIILVVLLLSSFQATLI